MKLVTAIPSKNPRKKYTAIFDDGTTVDFGGKGCNDFTIYWKLYGPQVAFKKRSAYIQRHRANEAWTDPKAPGTLSRILLWHFKTLQEGISQYDRVLRTWRKHPSLRYI